MSEKKKKLTSALVLLAATLLAASIIAARVKVEEKSSEVGPIGTTSVPRVGPVRVVRFTLYDVGIYPQEEHVRQGLVTISIEDLSGNKSSGLIVEPVETDERTQVVSVNPLANRVRARREMFLVAGRYEVSDARWRNNRASLIVDP